MMRPLQPTGCNKKELENLSLTALCATTDLVKIAACSTFVTNVHTAQCSVCIFLAVLFILAQFKYMGACNICSHVGSLSLKAAAT